MVSTGLSGPPLLLGDGVALLTMLLCSFQAARQDPLSEGMFWFVGGVGKGDFRVATAQTLHNRRARSRAAVASLSCPWSQDVSKLVDLSVCKRGVSVGHVTVSGQTVVADFLFAPVHNTLLACRSTPNAIRVHVKLPERARSLDRRGLTPFCYIVSSKGNQTQTTNNGGRRSAVYASDDQYHRC